MVNKSGCPNDPSLSQPDSLPPNIDPYRPDLETSHPSMSREKVSEKPPERGPDIQVPLVLPITSKTVGVQTEFIEPGTGEPSGPLKPLKRKDEFRELDQQEVMAPTAYSMGAEYAMDEEIPQDLYSDPLEALVPPVSELTKPDLEPPTPSVPVPVKPSHPDRRECPLCQEMSLNAHVLNRHMEIFHHPCMTDPDPQPSSHLYLFDHYQQWLEAINMTAGETAPSATQLLVNTRALAVESLNLLTKSKCLSHLQYDPVVDIPAAELAEVLACTDRLLTDLIHHLRELVGDDVIGHGPLAHWIGYQVGTENLPDPRDLLDDEDTINEWLAKIRNKFPTVPGQLLLSPPMPRQGTGLWNSDSFLLTSTGHPDAFLSNGPILSQPSLPPYIEPNRPDLETSYPSMGRIKVEENSPENTPDIQVFPVLSVTMVLDAPIPDVALPDSHSLSQPNNLYPTVPVREEEVVGPSKKRVVENPPERSPDIQVSPVLPIPSKAVGDQTDLTEPGTRVPQKRKEDFRELGQLGGLIPTTYAMMIECAGKEEKPEDPRKNDAVFTAEDHPDGSLWNDPCSPQPGYRPPAATTVKEKDLGSVLEDSHPAKSITEMKGNSPEKSPDSQFFPTTTGGGESLEALSCQPKFSNYPINQFTNRESGGDETRVTEPSPSAGEQLREKEDMFRTLLQQEPSSSTTTGTEYVTTMETPQSHPSTLAITSVAGRLSSAPVTSPAPDLLIKQLITINVEVVPRISDKGSTSTPTESTLENHATKHQVTDRETGGDKANRKTMSDEDILKLGAKTSIQTKVSITGAYDDACACHFGGFNVTDNLKMKLLHRELAPKELQAIIFLPKSRKRGNLRKLKEFIY